MHPHNESRANTYEGRLPDLKLEKRYVELKEMSSLTSILENSSSGSTIGTETLRSPPTSDGPADILQPLKSAFAITPASTTVDPVMWLTEYADRIDQHQAAIEAASAFEEMWRASNTKVLEDCIEMKEKIEQHVEKFQGNVPINRQKEHLETLRADFKAQQEAKRVAAVNVIKAKEELRLAEEKYRKATIHARRVRQQSTITEDDLKEREILVVKLTEELPRVLGHCESLVRDASRKAELIDALKEYCERATRFLQSTMDPQSAFLRMVERLRALIVHSSENGVVYNKNALNRAIHLVRCVWDQGALPREVSTLGSCIAAPDGGTRRKFANTGNATHVYFHAGVELHNVPERHVEQAFRVTNCLRYLRQHHNSSTPYFITEITKRNEVSPSATILRLVHSGAYLQRIFQTAEEAATSAPVPMEGSDDELVALDMESEGENEEYHVGKTLVNTFLDDARWKRIKCAHKLHEIGISSDADNTAQGLEVEYSATGGLDGAPAQEGSQGSLKNSSGREGLGTSPGGNGRQHNSGTASAPSTTDFSALRKLYDNEVMKAIQGVDFSSIRSLSLKQMLEYRLVRPGPIHIMYRGVVVTEGVFLPNGNFRAFGEEYETPSGMAMQCIRRKLNPDLQSISGYVAVHQNGSSLASIRNKFLNAVKKYCGEDTQGSYEVYEDPPDFEKVPTNNFKFSLFEKEIQNKNITIKQLIDSELLTPGPITIFYHKKSVEAGTLLKDGTFEYAGNVWQTPSSVALYVARKVNPDIKTLNGYSAIRRKGVKLETYRKAFVKKLKEAHSKKRTVQETSEEIEKEETVGTEGPAEDVKNSVLKAETETMHRRKGGKGGSLSPRGKGSLTSRGKGSLTPRNKAPLSPRVKGKASTEPARVTRKKTRSPGKMESGCGSGDNGALQYWLFLGGKLALDRESLIEIWMNDDRSGKTHSWHRAKINHQCGKYEYKYHFIADSNKRSYVLNVLHHLWRHVKESELVVSRTGRVRKRPQRFESMPNLPQLASSKRKLKDEPGQPVEKKRRFEAYSRPTYLIEDHDDVGERGSSNSSDSDEESGEGGLEDTFVSNKSHVACMQAAGVVCKAVDDIMSLASPVGKVFCLVRPPGHHVGRYGRTSGCCSHGFCLVNNVAIGVMKAKVDHGCKRVAVVDFDVHFGNGTYEIFEEDDDTLFISVHKADTGEGDVFFGSDLPGVDDVSRQNICISIDGGIQKPNHRGGRQNFTEAFQKTVFPALVNFDPEIIFLSSGFDGHMDDPLGGHLGLRQKDFKELTEHIVRIAERPGGSCNGRIVSVLEGGYDANRKNGSLQKCVNAHVKALCIPSSREENAAGGSGGQDAGTSKGTTSGTSGIEKTSFIRCV